MGNENQKSKTGDINVSIDHPRFQNARIISESGQRQLQTTMGVNEKENDRWNNALKKAKANSPFLLLPKTYDFSRKGLCGDSGTLTVRPFTPSSTTITIATS